MCPKNTALIRSRLCLGCSYATILSIGRCFEGSPSSAPPTLSCASPAPLPPIGRQIRYNTAAMQKACVLLVAALLTIRSLEAWDSEGHMMVAYIAFQNLTDR